jgi:hypothetical protein
MRQQTDPSERDFFIDVVRVASVAVVVFGHWLTTTVIWEDGLIDIENALSVVRRSHVATWLIQVMPLLFFAGGFSNERSLEHHDGHYLAFLRTRYRRLLTPTLVFVGVWLTVGVLAELLLDTLPNVLDRAADLAALPFWFLGLYLFVVALAPPMIRLHRRWGWWAVIAMAIGVVVVDVIYHGFGVTQIGVLNYAFVWLLAHQLGFFYADGDLAGLSRRIVGWATAAGLVGLIVLTTVGRYPVSMVGVPGDERWNTSPPSFALVTLTLWLVGLALLLRPWVLARAEAQPSLVARANRVVLTVFLWHVSAVALAAMVLYPLGFPEPETGTAAWWALRPVWLIMLVPPLVLLVLLFRRFEVHPQTDLEGVSDESAVRYVAAGIAVVSIGLGILGFGVTGFNRIAQDLGEGVLGFDLNPLQNILHLVLGLMVLWSAYQTDRLALAWSSVLSLSFLAVGVGGIADGIAILGMNSATAVLHVVLGALGLGLVGWAGPQNRQTERKSGERSNPPT